MSRAVDQRTSRTAPSLGEHTRAVWRRKSLVAAGLVLGLLLGIVVLPKVRTGQATYRATIRLKVAELVSDTIVPERPQFDTGRGNGGSGNALQDVELAGQVLDQIGPAAGSLRASEVAARLTATPVSRSPFVDLAYTDTDPERAEQVVEAYAKAWAAERNAFDVKRLRKAMEGVEGQIASLQQQVTELNAKATRESPGRAEVSQVQSRLDALVKLQDDVLRQRLFLGNPTDVLGTSVVSQLTSPPPRSLVLVLGLLIGLLVAIGSSLVLEAARPSVLAPADAERATGTQVIASVPKGGVRGGLAVVRRPFSPAAEGYRRVAGALERRGLGGTIRTLALVSPDPGEGKSLLAANLAHTLARQGQDVVLVSADLRYPRLDTLMDVEDASGLAEWLEHGTGETALPLQQVVDHLLVLPAGGTNRSPGELLTAARLRQGLAPLVDAGFVVLIDTPPALWSAEAMTLAAVADATVLIARTRTSRWRAVEQLAEALRRDGVRELGMVLLGDRRRLTARLFRKPYASGRSGRHQFGARNQPIPPPVIPPVVPPPRPALRPTATEPGYGTESPAVYNSLDPYITQASEHTIVQGGS
jgi:Mrp family chromosome partitioning ATPase